MELQVSALPPADTHALFPVCLSLVSTSPEELTSTTGLGVRATGRLCGVISAFLPSLLGGLGTLLPSVLTKGVLGGQVAASCTLARD